jgi:hypothetical protein
MSLYSGQENFRPRGSEMTDHRQGRSREAGDRDGEDSRRVARIRARQDFWDVVQSVRRTRRST